MIHFLDSYYSMPEGMKMSLAGSQKRALCFLCAQAVLSCVPVLRKEVPEHPVRVIQKPPGHLVVLRLLIVHQADARFIQEIDPRPRVGHQDGRVGGDNELGLHPHQLVHLPQQRQLPGGRQSRLRLVQEVEAVTAEAVLHQARKLSPWDCLWRETPP